MSDFRAQPWYRRGWDGSKPTNYQARQGMTAPREPAEPVTRAVTQGATTGAGAWAGGLAGAKIGAGLGSLAGPVVPS